MSGKQEKKIRQLARRMYSAKLDALTEAQRKWLQERPKWVPVWLWKKMHRLA